MELVLIIFVLFLIAIGLYVFVKVVPEATIELKKERAEQRLNGPNKDAEVIEQLSAVPAAGATKRCPYCAEEILIAAIKCKHCQSQLLFDGAFGSQSHHKRAFIGMGICFVSLSAIILLTYFNMSTVPPNGTVHNIGLLNERETGVMLGVGMLISGTILFTAGCCSKHH